MYLFGRNNIRTIVLLIILGTLILLSLKQSLSEQQEAKARKLQLIQRPGHAGEIPLPGGYERPAQDISAYAHFLRTYPLKPQDTLVTLFDGSPKPNQKAHYAILDVDIGNRNLLQCADAIMCLYGLYHYQRQDYAAIHFNLVRDNKPRYFVDYSDSRDSETFRSYMDYIYGYANTRSLKNEMAPLPDTSAIRIGDVFIVTGNPYGHAVFVMDKAVKRNTGETIFLLAQSFMPAQEIHILKNPNDTSLSPWYRFKPKHALITPEWRFPPGSRHRFPDETVHD